MNPGEELLLLIRQYVGNTPEHERIVEIVALTMVTMMSDQRFTSHLQVVQQLQAENALLRQNLGQLQAMVARFQPLKTAPRKKAAPRKRPAKKVSGSTPKNRRAFQDGLEG